MLQIHDSHFWTLCTNSYMGTLRLEVIGQANAPRLVAMTRSILQQVGVAQVTIEVTLAD